MSPEVRNYQIVFVVFAHISRPTRDLYASSGWGRAPLDWGRPGSCQRGRERPPLRDMDHVSLAPNAPRMRALRAANLGLATGDCDICQARRRWAREARQPIPATPKRDFTVLGWAVTT